jgi:hypothetical protein
MEKELKALPGSDVRKVANRGEDLGTYHDEYELDQ